MNTIGVKIIGWAIELTTYAILIVGLFCLWYYLIFEVMIRYALIALKVMRNFAEYIWYRKSFLRWLSKAQNVPVSDTTESASSNEADNQINQTK